MIDEPFISIITITFNNLSGIQTTLESILASDINKAVEWIVVDGGSNDGTESYINSCRVLLLKRNCTLDYRNEKDRGRYDGMNKGIERMHGKWCIFLNAGDAFCFNTTLPLLINTASEVKDSIGLIYGDSILAKYGKYKYAKAPDTDMLNFKGPNPICHQSCLIRTDIMKKYKYDITYKYAADFDFIVKLYKNNISFKYINTPVSLYDKTGLSSKNTFAVNIEFSEISHKYGYLNNFEYERKINGNKKIKRIIKKYLPKSFLLLALKLLNDREMNNWSENIESVYKIR